MIAWLQRLVSLGLRNGPRASEIFCRRQVHRREAAEAHSRLRKPFGKIWEMKNLNALRTKAHAERSHFLTRARTFDL